MYTRARWIAGVALLALCSTAGAQALETYVGGARFDQSPALDTPIMPGGSGLMPDGTLIVVDAAGSSVLRFDPAASTATLLPAQPDRPVYRFVTDVTTDVAGNVYAILDNRLVRLNLENGTDTALSSSGFEQATQCFGHAWAPVKFSYPQDIATDPAGHVYVVDTGSSNVCRVNSFGDSQLFAGSPYGSTGYDGDGGPATEATLDYPTAVTVDAQGNVYIADSGNHRIRKVSSVDGIITTYAGGGEWGSIADGTPALAAYIDYVTALSTDAAGNLYIVDEGAKRVFRIDANTGLLTTVAGNGSWDPSGDGGPAVQAGFGFVTGLTVGTNGDLYISDSDARRLRRVSAATGIIDTVLGNGETSYCGDGGPRLQACLYGPDGVALDAQGNLYISDRHNGRLRKVDTLGTITTVAGNGAYSGHGGDGGPANQATFSHELRGVAVDASGNIYLATGYEQRIRRIDAATGVITTIAGDGGTGFVGDGGLATAARLNFPTHVAVDASGNVYFSDATNRRVRRIDAASGVITTVAGGGLAGAPASGVPATATTLGSPGALAFDVDGSLLIVDNSQPRIRRVDAATGIITTIAGNGAYFLSGDGGLATLAGLGGAPTLLVEPNGDILVAANYQVRRISRATGIIDSLAFSLETPEGITLQQPTGMARDAAGNLYVSDGTQNRVFRVSGIPQPPVDSTPPVITPVRQGSAGADGWYRSDVRVIFQVVDEESAVTRSGCETVDVTQDTPGITFTCTASSAGGESSASVTVKRDATPPMLTFAAPSPAANAFGWHGSAVSIAFTVSDAMSGVAGTSRDSPLLFDIDGTGMQRDVVVVDQAGNQATFVSSQVNIDRTPPVLQPQVTGVAGNNGWYRSDVQVAWSIDDFVESSVDCDGGEVTTDTAGRTFSCTATSAGGTTSSSVTIRRDATPPQLTFGAASPLPNANGWNKTNVSIPFTRSDALSGVASTSSASPLVLGTEGAGVTGEVQVTDQAGNTATFTSIPRNIDKTAPVISIASPASGATFGFYQDVVADYACEDVSLKTCSGPVASGALVNTRSAGSRTFKVSSTDHVSYSRSLTHNYTVESAFNWEGFLAPLSPPSTLNLVPRGSLVPIRWKLPDGRGGFVTNTASFASATVGSLSCGSAPAVPLADTATGPAGISFDGDTATFTYNWQTSASWTGCRRLTIKLRDNTTHELRFRFQ